MAQETRRTMTLNYITEKSQMNVENPLGVFDKEAIPTSIAASAFFIIVVACLLQVLYKRSPLQEIYKAEEEEQDREHSRWTLLSLRFVTTQNHSQRKAGPDTEKPLQSSPIGFAIKLRKCRRGRRPLRFSTSTTRWGTWAQSQKKT